MRKYSRRLPGRGSPRRRQLRAPLRPEFIFFVFLWRREWDEATESTLFTKELADKLQSGHRVEKKSSTDVDDVEAEGAQVAVEDREVSAEREPVFLRVPRFGIEQRRIEKRGRLTSARRS